MNKVTAMIALSSFFLTKGFPLLRKYQEEEH